MMNKQPYEEGQQRVGFLERFYMIFSLTVIVFSVSGAISGEDIGIFHNLYRLGNAGVSNITIFQFMFTSLFISLIVGIFLSEKLFKNMMFLKRVIWMLICISVFMSVFIIIFDWFPIDFWPGWIGFFSSFGVCSALSILLTSWKIRKETKRYEELLERYKSNREDEESSVE